jgi:hypothetical protein
MGILQTRKVSHDVWSPVAVTYYTKIHCVFTELLSLRGLEVRPERKENQDGMEQMQYRLHRKTDVQWN